MTKGSIRRRAARMHGGVLGRYGSELGFGNQTRLLRCMIGQSPADTTSH